MKLERGKRLDYASHTLDKALKTKEDYHWKSDFERQKNREVVGAYDAKKRAACKAYLQTESSVLKDNRHRIDEKNLIRMNGEFGRDKIEIYEKSFFLRERSHGIEGVLGYRGISDGEIGIKDNDDFSILIHTSTHEALHDLSYQDSNKEVMHDWDNNLSKLSMTEKSGIFEFINEELIKEGEIVEKNIIEGNRGLNEGITESYAIDELMKRKDSVPLKCYTQEVKWALNIRGKLGDDIVADAYFGGKVVELEERFNNVSNNPNGWSNLNYNIDMYHRTGLPQYKYEADNIIYSLYRNN